MLTAADGGGPLCHFVTSPHTVGSPPLGKGAFILFNFKRRINRVEHFILFADFLKAHLRIFKG